MEEPSKVVNGDFLRLNGKVKMVKIVQLVARTRGGRGGERLHHSQYQSLPGRPISTRSHGENVPSLSLFSSAFDFQPVRERERERERKK